MKKPGWQDASDWYKYDRWLQKRRKEIKKQMAGYSGEYEYYVIKRGGFLGTDTIYESAIDWESAQERAAELNKECGHNLYYADSCPTIDEGMP